ncbi:MAG: hypothetical protein WCC65_17950, partial [Pseudonocardiaceae bacterium]
MEREQYVAAGVVPGSPVRSRRSTVASQESARGAGHPVGALAPLVENYAAWVAGVRRLGGEGLARAC